MTVQVFLWPARRDLNPRSSESESAALSNCATGGYIFHRLPLMRKLSRSDRRREDFAEQQIIFCCFILSIRLLLRKIHLPPQREAK